MLAAIVLLLLFFSSRARLIAALVGGAGFGAFIDEVGKFVTSDNDYFFRPTAALVYALFVVFFPATREVRRFRALSPEESLVNAVELAKKLAMRTLTADERDRALELLDQAHQTHPLVAPLRASFQSAGLAPVEFARRQAGEVGREPQVRRDRLEPLVPARDRGDLHPRGSRIPPQYNGGGGDDRRSTSWL